MTMDYEMQNWHVTIMTIAVALIATAFNTFAARRLPMFEGIILYLHILLWFGVSTQVSQSVYSS
jgi:hypothetical protein